MEKIYLDHAAATPLDPRVAAFITKSQSVFGNASSLHSEGRKAKKMLEESRSKVARVLGASAREIVFTSSGTESVNLAILGVVMANKKSGKHIITSKIEHLSVLKVCEYLERNEGFKVTYLDIQKNGVIDPEVVRKALRADTILVSIMYANNEIGTIQPIAKISKVIRGFRRNKPVASSRSLIANEKLPVFHVDACQAAGALDLNVQKLGVDLMSLNGSKIYGPKGTGCLFVRRGVNIEPILFGGSQEMGRRAGTENVPLLAGFAMALELADKNRIKESARLTKLRDYLISRIEALIEVEPQSRRGLTSELTLRPVLNGDAVLRLPNNINISFTIDNTFERPFKSIVDGEMLVLTLDQKGIEVSTGSACTTSETGSSHVLKAIKDSLSEVEPHSGNLRITLGRSTTKKDLDYLLKVLPWIVGKLKL